MTQMGGYDTFESNIVYGISLYIVILLVFGAALTGLKSILTNFQGTAKPCPLSLSLSK